MKIRLLGDTEWKQREPQRYVDYYHYNVTEEVAKIENLLKDRPNSLIFLLIFFIDFPINWAPILIILVIVPQSYWLVSS